MNWESLLALPVYQLCKEDRAIFFQQQLMELTRHHYNNCADYKTIINNLYPDTLEKQQVPPLAVQLFKHHLLQSIDDETIFKITTSSGTTSQQLSRIVLDKISIRRQQQVLSAIVAEWLGNKRLPMLIIDHPNVIKDSFSYSARGVGIQGLSIFGHHHTYALDESMELNLTAIESFVAQYQQQKIFIFGFTYMIWQYFLLALEKQNRQFDLSNVVVLHSGGWKKIQQQAVSNQQFKQRLSTMLGNTKIHNFYGMVEQTGTIHVECEQGHLHCPVWSDVIIRDKTNLQPVMDDREGLIQVNSLLPTSYPGHALLTEDLGHMVGEDDCPCGKKGKYFRVHGRLAKAELRGCSDAQA